MIHYLTYGRSPSLIPNSHSKFTTLVPRYVNTTITYEGKPSTVIHRTPSAKLTAPSSLMLRLGVLTKLIITY